MDTEEQKEGEGMKDSKEQYLIGVDTVTTPSIVSTCYVVTKGNWDVTAVFRVDSKPEDPAILKELEELFSKHYEGCKIISEETCLLKKRK